MNEHKVYCDECEYLQERPTMAETAMGSGVYYQTGTRFYCPKQNKWYPLNTTKNEVGYSYCLDGIKKAGDNING